MHSTKRRPRFTLLTCLEYGELYFGDHAATFLPSRAQSECLALRRAELHGRLMVASGSLTFEPDDSEAPLLRILLRDVRAPLSEWSSSGGHPPGVQAT